MKYSFFKYKYLKYCSDTLYLENTLCICCLCEKFKSISNKCVFKNTLFVFEIHFKKYSAKLCQVVVSIPLQNYTIYLTLLDVVFRLLLTQTSIGTYVVYVKKWIHFENVYYMHAVMCPKAVFSIYIKYDWTNTYLCMYTYTISSLSAHNNQLVAYTITSHSTNSNI